MKALDFINGRLPVSLRRRVFLVSLLLSAYQGFTGCGVGADAERNRDEERVAPVAVAKVERRSIESRQVFSGTLSAFAEFTVAPKVEGRIIRIAVDEAETVNRGQVVAEIDDAEYVQAQAQAEADVAVAEAELMQARNGLEIARRENQRVETLRERGVASDSQYDTIQAEFLSAQAQLRVAEARLQRARAQLEMARLQLSYTRVTADWPEGDDERIVAERYLDEGQIIRPNDPLLRIVEIDPVLAEIYVTEKDYSRMRPGQRAVLVTDAFPERTFKGEILRVASIFRETTRQAKVEIRIDNPDTALKPGMFVRATLTMARVEDALTIPEAALTVREGTTGVFAVNGSGDSVKWVPVELGLSDGKRVELVNSELSGRVVTLGQHLINDGSPVVIAREEAEGV